MPSRPGPSWKRALGWEGVGGHLPWCTLGHGVLDAEVFGQNLHSGALEGKPLSCLELRAQRETASQVGKQM